MAEVRGWGGTPEGTDMPWGWGWGVSDCGGWVGGRGRRGSEVGVGGRGFGTYGGDEGLGGEHGGEGGEGGSDFDGVEGGDEDSFGGGGVRHFSAVWGVDWGVLGLRKGWCWGFS